MMAIVPNFNLDRIDRDYVLRNLMAAVRPHIEDCVYTIPCADLDMYFKCIITEDETGGACFKLTDELIDRFDLDHTTLRSYAWSNAIDKITCRSITEIIGAPVMEGEPMIYVLTTQNQTDGAGPVLLCTAKLKELAVRLKVEELFVIPSSRHEILALAYDEDMRAAIDDMVRTVNQSEVAPEDRLADHAYIFRAEDGSLRW